MSGLMVSVLAASGVIFFLIALLTKRLVPALAAAILMAAISAVVFTSLDNSKNTTPASTAVNLPDTLMYNGKPINPECLRNAPQMLSDNCGIKDQTTKNGDFISETTAKNNYAENSYMCDAETYCGFFSYEYIGPVADGLLIKTVSSGGGSGVFTTLAVYERRDDAINLLYIIDGGDRCNGGIQESHIDANGHVSYTTHVTAAGLFQALKPADIAEDALNTLPDCAACCYATANITGNDITSITFTDDNRYLQATDIDDPATVCFNKIVQDHIKTAGTSLDKAAAENMMAKIASTCASN